MSYTEYICPDPPNYVAGASGSRIEYAPSAYRKYLTDFLSPGCYEVDFAVTWSSGMTVTIAAGIAYVLGGNAVEQGLYRQYKSAAQNLTISAADATKPRIDQIIIRIFDHDSDVSGEYEGRVQIIPGTATTGATLANRLGAADLTTLDEASKSVLLLADVLVPAAAATLDVSKVSDRRVLLDSAVVNGWHNTSAEWVYVSATSFKEEGVNTTARYTPGMPISYTDGGATGYANVLSSVYAAGDTTITITGGSDYTLSGGAITDPRYSYISNPYGFPDRFIYTPTEVGWAAGATFEDFWFSITGRKCLLSGSVSGTSDATSTSVTLPVTSAATRVTRACAYGVNNGTVIVSNVSILAAATSATFSCADSSTGWTNSGTKKVQFQVSYPI